MTANQSKAEARKALYEKGAVTSSIKIKNSGESTGKLIFIGFLLTIGTIILGYLFFTVAIDEIREFIEEQDSIQIENNL